MKIESHFNGMRNRATRKLFSDDNSLHSEE
jgi:hypothetical protein